MVLFFNSSYTEVWSKLVAGLDWARRFRVRMSAGMQPTAAAVGVRTDVQGRVQANVQRLRRVGW